jgi:hypothetical protein
MTLIELLKHQNWQKADQINTGWCRTLTALPEATRIQRFCSDRVRVRELLGTADTDSIVRPVSWGSCNYLQSDIPDRSILTTPMAVKQAEGQLLVDSHELASCLLRAVWSSHHVVPLCHLTRSFRGLPAQATREALVGCMLRELTRWADGCLQSYGRTLWHVHLEAAVRTSCRLFFNDGPLNAVTREVFLIHLLEQPNKELVICNL